MNFSIDNLIRSNIKKLIPYSSARSEYKGTEGVFLDANENNFDISLGKKVNRYPDPLQLNLKEGVSKIKGLPIENIFLGNGSDEAIDILYRAFCNPGIDNVIVCPPTYGMYEVSANINDVEVQKVNLTAEEFQLNTEFILKAINDKTKLIFLCCPNNPTGNGVKWLDIQMILDSFKGIVVIDEAYINFASYRSLIPELVNYPNLVILQTMSKAWGLAGIRIGMAFASQVIIDVFNKVKAPYNISVVSQQLALEALGNLNQVNEVIREIIVERNRMENELNKMDCVIKVYPSDSNFLLVKFKNSDSVFNFLQKNKIIVRNRNKMELCSDCLRITIGTPIENNELIKVLNNL